MGEGTLGKTPFPLTETRPLGRGQGRARGRGLRLCWSWGPPAAGWTRRTRRHGHPVAAFVRARHISICSERSSSPRPALRFTVAFCKSRRQEAKLPSALALRGGRWLQGSSRLLGSLPGTVGCLRGHVFPDKDILLSCSLASPIPAAAGAGRWSYLHTEHVLSNCPVRGPEPAL